MEHFHLLDNLDWSFLFLFLQREKRMGVKCNWMYCVTWSQCHFRFYFISLRAACGCLHVYKFYPVLNHVACISAQALAALIAQAVMGQSSTPASSISVGLPQTQPRQPPTKPISSDVQATHHSQKRRVEENEDQPAAKRRLISKQGRVDSTFVRFLRSIVSWLFQQLCVHSVLIFYLLHSSWRGRAKSTKNSYLVLNHVACFTDSCRPSTSAGPVSGAVAVTCSGINYYYYYYYYNPNSLQIWFLDFFHFSLFSLASPSTRLIS